MDTISPLDEVSIFSNYILDGTSTNRPHADYIEWIVRTREEGNMITTFYGPFSRIAALLFIKYLDEEDMKKARNRPCPVMWDVEDEFKTFYGPQEVYEASHPGYPLMTEFRVGRLSTRGA